MKILSSFLVFLFIFEFVVVGVLAPRVALAIAPIAPIVGAPVTYPGVGGASEVSAVSGWNALLGYFGMVELKGEAKDAAQKFWEQMLKMLLVALAQVAMNVSVVIAQEAGKAAGNLITTGGVGKQPLFHAETWSKMARDQADYVTGKVMDVLRDKIKELTGIDICDPGANMMILIGLHLYSPPTDTSECGFRKLSKNYSALGHSIIEKYRGLRDVSRESGGGSRGGAAATYAFMSEIMKVSTGPKNADLASGIMVDDNVKEALAKEKWAYENQRLEGGGMKPLVNWTGLNIKTPAEYVKVLASEQIKDPGKAQDQITGQAYGIAIQVPEAMFNIFMQTMVGTVLKNIMLMLFFKKGMLADQQFDLTGNILSDFGDTPLSYKSQDRFAQEYGAVSTVKMGINSQQLDLLSEFVVCPTPRGANNCVLNNNFANAFTISITQNKPLTVKDAIAQNYLNPNLEFVKQVDAEEGDLRDQAADCYLNNFCYSNLKKMRFARLIPIGWEMAAEVSSSGDTLAKAIAEFEVPTSKFYHLVDPDWILIAPPIMCNKYQYGEELIGPEMSERAQVCVDQSSCLKKNDNDECIAYGKCAAEKKTYRFGGTECQGQYDSCQSFSARDNTAVSVLMNTVDFAGCDANNVGCKWYATIQDRKDKDLYQWNQTASNVYDNFSLGKIFLNKNIESTPCDPSSEGCTGFLRTKVGLGTNLARNSGFEVLKTDGFAEDWGAAIDGTSTVVTDAAKVFAGNNALELNNLYVRLSNDLLVEPKTFKRFFAVSAVVKSDGAASFFISPTNLFDAGVSCRNIKNSLGSVAEASDCSEETDLLPSSGATDWTLVYGIWEISAKGPNLLEKLNFSFKSPGTIYLDNVMIQEIDLPTFEAMKDYREYGGNETAVAHLRKAPRAYGCYDTTDNTDYYARPAKQGDIVVNNPVKKKLCADGSSCVNPSDCVGHYHESWQSTTCAEFDVYVCDDLTECTNRPVVGSGSYPNQTITKNECEKYEDDSGAAGTCFVATKKKKVEDEACSNYAQLCTAQDVGCEAYKPTNGGETVNGLVSYYDYCPQECAGYNTYNQSATYFEEQKFPNYLIPATAQTCPAAEVGCDEFTNLNALTAGGESKEYYSEIRYCAKMPEQAPSCANFYTWTGNEVAGFQLQAYYLQKEELYDNGTLIGLAPTYNFNFSQTERNELCNEDIYTKRSNPDCRQVYDEAGKVSYRLLSRTITCSEQCQPLRKSEQYTDTVAKFLNSDQCTARGGSWSAGLQTCTLTAEQECNYRHGEYRNGECIFWTLPTESRSCQAVNNKCREYKGNYAGDEQIELAANFSSTEDLLGYFHDASPVTLADGQYVKSDDTNKTITIYGDSVKLLPSKHYNLSFWAKGLDVGITIQTITATITKDGGAITAAEQVVTQSAGDSLKDDWRFYSYDFVLPETFVAEEEATNQVEIVGTAQFYLDNFKLRIINDTNYLIKNSWTTPASCDNRLDDTPTAAEPRRTPYAMVGCREYVDREGTRNYLKTFSGLCKEDKVGCEALIDTKNTAVASAQSYYKTIGDEALCNDYFQKTAKSGGCFRGVGTANEPSYNTTICPFTNPKITAVNVGPVVESSVKYCKIEYYSNATHELNVSECGGYSCDWFATNNLSFNRKAIAVINLNTGVCYESGNEWTADGVCRQKVSTVPSDNLMYLIIDEVHSCDAAQKGCVALGKPNLSVDKSGIEVIKDTNETEVFSTDFTIEPTKISFEAPLVSPVVNKYETDAQGNRIANIRSGSDYTSFTTDINAIPVSGSFKVSFRAKSRAADTGAITILALTSTNALANTSPNSSIAGSLTPTWKDYVLAVTSAVDAKIVVQSALDFQMDDFKIVKTSGSAFDTLHYIVDPEKFNDQSISPLCQSFDVGCEQFKTADNKTYYFRNSGDQACVYRGNQTGTGNAWFQKAAYARGEFVECGVTDYYNDAVAHPYRNTDKLYSGWVGECPAEQDKCTAFVDPTDRQVPDQFALRDVGRAFYYINNQSIDKSTCTSVRREDGCVLFNDTSIRDQNWKPIDTWSSYLTYYATRNQNAAVAPVVQEADYQAAGPVNCNGFEYCKEMEKCILKKTNGLTDNQNPAAFVNYCITDIQSTDSRPSTADFIEPACATEHLGDVEFEDSWSPNADTTSFVAVALDNTARSTYLNDINSFNAQCTAERLLKNDTNVVVKVTRDRECAAWYDCASQHYVRDDANNTYISVCDSLNMCQGLSNSTEGDGGTCTDQVFFENKENILTSNQRPQDVPESSTHSVYQDRPVDWFALDYSGYTVPTAYPLQNYGSRNVSKNLKVSDYRLVNIDTWKYCADTFYNNCNDGIDNNNDDRCDHAGCPNPSNPTQNLLADPACTADDGSGREQAGNGASSVTEATLTTCDDYPDFCLRANGDPANGTQSADYNYCRCFASGCARPAVPGAAFADDVAKSPKPQCRAYPEATSPFPYSAKYNSENNNQKSVYYGNVNVVTLLQRDATNTITESAMAIDDALKSEDLGCFYKKIYYGGSQVSAYVPMVEIYPHLKAKNVIGTPEGICQYDQTVGCSIEMPAIPETETTPAYSPTKNGLQFDSPDCGGVDNPDARIASESYGTCLRLNATSIANYRGLQGFCLDRDKSTILYGDVNSHPCLTWYPVDSLAGLSDSLNQFEAAGFNWETYVPTDDAVAFCTSSSFWERRYGYIRSGDAFFDCGVTWGDQLAKFNTVDTDPKDFVVNNWKEFSRAEVAMDTNNDSSQDSRGKGMLARRPMNYIKQSDPPVAPNITANTTDSLVDNRHTTYMETRRDALRDVLTSPPDGLERTLEDHRNATPLSVIKCANTPGTNCLDVDGQINEASSQDWMMRTKTNGDPLVKQASTSGDHLGVVDCRLTRNDNKFSFTNIPTAVIDNVNIQDADQHFVIGYETATPRTVGNTTTLVLDGYSLPYGAYYYWRDSSNPPYETMWNEFFEQDLLYAPDTAFAISHPNLNIPLIDEDLNRSTYMLARNAFMCVGADNNYSTFPFVADAKSKWKTIDAYGQQLAQGSTIIDTTDAGGCTNDLLRAYDLYHNCLSHPNDFQGIDCEMGNNPTAELLCAGLRNRTGFESRQRDFFREKYIVPQLGNVLQPKTQFYLLAPTDNSSDTSYPENYNAKVLFDYSTELCSPVKYTKLKNASGTCWTAAVGGDNPEYSSINPEFCTPDSYGSSSIGFWDSTCSDRAGQPSSEQRADLIYSRYWDINNYWDINSMNNEDEGFCAKGGSGYSNTIGFMKANKTMTSMWLGSLRSENILDASGNMKGITCANGYHPERIIQFDVDGTAGWDSEMEDDIGAIYPIPWTYFTYTYECLPDNRFIPKDGNGVPSVSYSDLAGGAWYKKGGTYDTDLTSVGMPDVWKFIDEDNAGKNKTAAAFDRNGQADIDYFIYNGNSPLRYSPEDPDSITLLADKKKFLKDYPDQDLVCEKFLTVPKSNVFHTELLHQADIQGVACDNDPVTAGMFSALPSGLEYVPEDFTTQPLSLTQYSGNGHNLLGSLNVPGQVLSPPTSGTPYTIPFGSRYNIIKLYGKNWGDVEDSDAEPPTAQPRLAKYLKRENWSSRDAGNPGEPGELVTTPAIGGTQCFEDASDLKKYFGYVQAEFTHGSGASVPGASQVTAEFLNDQVDLPKAEARYWAYSLTDGHVSMTEPTSAGRPVVAAVDYNSASDGPTAQPVAVVGGGLKNPQTRPGKAVDVINLKFYAWAHDDMMPLTKILVDWGDGFTSWDLDGLYKNKKPRCQQASTGEAMGVCTRLPANESNPSASLSGIFDAAIMTALIPGYACKPEMVLLDGTGQETSEIARDQGCWYREGGEKKHGACYYKPGTTIMETYATSLPVVRNRKGDTTEACSEGYLAATHPYICGSLTNLTACDREQDPYQRLTGPCKYTDPDGKEYCSFKPRVVVTDQWGYCNLDSRAQDQRLKPQNPKCSTYSDFDYVGEWLDDYILVAPY